MDCTLKPLCLTNPFPFYFQGTTWLQEIIYLLQHDADTELAKSKTLYDRSPFLELGEPVSMLEYAATLPSPRVLKTHLSPSFFAKALESTQAKFVFPFRNVKDTLFSFYNFYKNCKLLGNYTGSFDEFFELFKQKKLVFGDWCDFYLDWWSKRHNSNIHFLKFEDLKKDTKKEVQNIAAFLGMTLTEAQIDIICKHVSFDAMKANPTFSRGGSGVTTDFMRKGQVGDWTNWLSTEQNDYLDKLLADRLRGSGLEIQDKL